MRRIIKAAGVLVLVMVSLLAGINAHHSITALPDTSNTILSIQADTPATQEYFELQEESKVRTTTLLFSFLFVHLQRDKSLQYATPFTFPKQFFSLQVHKSLYLEYRQLLI